MASSLLDLGSYERLETAANWSAEVKSKILQAKTVLQFPGTIKQSVEQSSYRPMELSKGFLLGRADAYDFIDFWINREGRHGAFWVYSEFSQFRLAQAVTSSDTILTCNYNYFDLACQGHERLYLFLKNGDRITRKITAAEKVSGNLELTVSAINQDIALSSIKQFGRCVLARFDSDKLSCKYLNSGTMEVRIGFKELIREYPA